MMVVVALMALMTSIVAPRFTAGQDGARVRSAVAELSRILADARLTALRQGDPARVLIDPAGQRIVDAHGDSVAIEPPLKVQARTDGPRTGSAVALDFFPDGSASEAFITVSSREVRRDIHLDGVVGRIERR